MFDLRNEQKRIRGISVTLGEREDEQTADEWMEGSWLQLLGASARKRKPRDDQKSQISNGIDEQSIDWDRGLRRAGMERRPVDGTWQLAGLKGDQKEDHGCQRRVQVEAQRGVERATSEKNE